MNKALIISSLFLLVLLESCSKNQGEIIVLNQSEQYGIVDNTFKIKSLSSDSVILRLKTGKEHKLDSGRYRVTISFHASQGIFYNDGKVWQDITVLPDRTTSIYLTGGELSGMFGSDPKIEVDN